MVQLAKSKRTIMCLLSNDLLHIVLLLLIIKGPIMLITFSCKAHASVTMFGEVGLQFIKMLGHSGKIPGAIDASEVPQALNNLRTAIAAEQNQAVEQDGIDDDNEDEVVEAPVNIGSRAFPLVELLKAAIKEECEVMWEDGSGKRL
jgi:hypothetical protein